MTPPFNSEVGVGGIHSVYGLSQRDRPGEKRLDCKEFYSLAPFWKNTREKGNSIHAVHAWYEMGISSEKGAKWLGLFSTDAYKLGILK